MTPEISIVIPTHNRATMLPHTLDALAQQTVAPSKYEVILVADGCEDNTAAIVKALKLPYHLKFIEQNKMGAGAARNRGAEAAAAPIILFLDDDMEAAPALVAEHLKAHSRQPGSLVLGNFVLEPDKEATDIFVASSNLWWTKHLNAKAQPDHRFTFWDVCTGNMSLPRQAFQQVGGFDIRFNGKSGEDYEIGIRLLKQGVPICFAAQATSIHHDTPTQERSLKRALAEGRGQVLIAKKHPELFSELRLAWPASGLVLGWLWKNLWKHPLLADLVVQPVKFLLELSRKAGWRKQWGRIYGCVNEYNYWLGVRKELKSLSVWQRMAQTAPLKAKASQYNEIDLDLATALTHLDKILSRQAVDGLRLWYGKTPLGRIAPVAGAEPLRPIHVREALVHQFTNPLLAMLLMDELKQSQLENEKLLMPELTTTSKELANPELKLSFKSMVIRKSRPANRVKRVSKPVINVAYAAERYSVKEV